MFNLHNRLRSVQLFLAGLSLQTRFLLIFGASSLFLALAVWIAFNNITDRMIEHIGTRFAENQAFYDKTHTLQPLIQKAVLIRRIADSAAIRRWAAHEQNPQLYRQALAEMKMLSAQNDGYLVLITKSGNYYSGDTGEQSPKEAHHTPYPEKPGDAWLHAASRNALGNDINVEGSTDPDTGEIWISAPLRDGDKVLGVIGASMRSSDFTSPATDASQSGVSSIFIGRDAAIHIHRGIEHIDFSGAANPPARKLNINQMLDEPEDMDWIRQSIGQIENGGQAAVRALHIKGKRYLASSPVATKFVHINGKHYLASMTALPEVGWYDITLMDTSVLLSQHDFMEIWLMIGAVALGLMVILLFSLRRLVLHPVAVLTAASDRIRQGDYAGVSTKKGSGEIGRLTVQFQAMRHAVHKTHNWMEDEIRKRTRQLRDTKEMLEVSLQQERNSRENLANLLSLMAHEIRSPIAVIGNTAQMLNVLAQSERPDWQPRIEKIMGAVLQLTVLMSKFLDEDRINRKDNELNLQMGDLDAFCAELANTLAANHGRTIRYSPWSGDAMLMADWHLVGIAIGNLIDNAIKYSLPDSEIDLRVAQNDAGTLYIEVTDRGPGIPPELQQHIFTEKFIRGKHSRKIRGTGLGLYLSNWIAISHGGYAEVSSKPDCGSTFRIYLPLRKTA